ncbi:MAG: exonuclease domain-containing protein [Lachnospiraceae bacterium]|jgi:inhibitor of KinA sporulation pathway (predicted exonuclease)|nr:exonuclease domain-containing protein [Lachnospiraceae bacterium]
MKDFIVFDLEWNQSPAGKEESLDCLPFEIFEIGAVKLNEKFEKLSEFHRLIRPCVYPKLHPLIAQMTHVTTQELDSQGLPFVPAMKEFLDWCGREAFFCTWGGMDLTELQRNMAYHGMEIPFPHPFLFYDVQKLYSLCRSDGKSRESLDEAVKKLEIQTPQPFHRALEDARYTAEILTMLDFPAVQEYVSVDYYHVPQTRKEEFTLEFPEYSKFVSRAFPTKEEAMADKRVTDVICYKCHRMLRKKIRWFSYGQRFYLCLAVCPEHGPIKAKIRMKKSENGEVFAVRTEKLVGDEGVKLVVKKKEETRLRNSERGKTKKAKPDPE